MNELIDTSKQEKAEKKADRKRNRELSDIRFILKSPEGRRFYWRVMSTAGVFVRSYTGDTNSTMFNEGKRELGNFLFSELFEAKPEAFAQLQQEHLSEVESERRAEELEKKQSSDLV
jgi:hypothetical protein